MKNLQLLFLPQDLWEETMKVFKAKSQGYKFTKRQLQSWKLNIQNLYSASEL